MDLTDGFIVGNWQVKPLDGKIFNTLTSESTRVRPKAMDVLCALAAAGGQVVERDELLTQVWGQDAVSDEPLTSTIGELRRLLGERQGQERRYIETIPKRGYRLLPQARAIHRSRAEAVSSTRMKPRRLLDRNTLIALVLLTALTAFVVYRFSAPDLPVDWAAPKNSIAVLPFERLSAGNDNNYFADGLAEELIVMLNRLPSITVAARNSTFLLQDKALPLTDIARRLNVAHILTGSVQQAGEQVRVTARLVDARTGYQLWSATYDRTLKDIFAIQDDIAMEVQTSLQVHLVGARVVAQPTSTEAYALYLQARHVGRQHTKEGLVNAASLYQEVLAIDPEYLPAWDGLAGVYLNQVGFALLPAQEGFRLASEAAYKALAIDADYAPAHGRLGWIALHANSNIAAAAEHYRQALSVEPENDIIRSGAAPVALALGRMNDAIVLFENSVTTDPVSPASHANLANAYLLAGRYVEAEQSIRNALTLSPNYAGAQYRLGRALLAQGKLSEAKKAMAAEPADAARWIGQALVADVEGNVEASNKLLGRVLERYGNAAAGNLAQVYAHRGDIDAAYKWLDLEFTTSGAGGFAEYRWDPLFASLHDDPRWAALMERVGLSNDALKVIEFPTLAELAQE
jgi:TolB-like protein/DNA-binding winged helix-turn-helix (wHTH) protein/TolA-binding protein